MSTYSNVSGIKVSPGIGMGRVGNSSEYFLGPEIPNVVPDPGEGEYKDASGALKRQAQRFRVFALAGDGSVMGEVVDGDTVNGQPVKIEWNVHLTNMKAANYCFQGEYGFNPAQLRNSTIQAGLSVEQRDSLIIDPGPKTITGVSQGPTALLDTNGSGSTIFDVPSGSYSLSGLLKFDPPQGPGETNGVPNDVPVTYTPATMVSLGDLYTDDDGRLIVVGGEGRAGSTTSPAVVISKITQEIPDPNDPSKMIPDPNPEYNGNSYFNNPGWYDDTSGGSVDAVLVNADTGAPLFNTAKSPTTTGWMSVAPPKYAPASFTVVSLLDLQLNLFPEMDPYTGQGPIVLASGNVPENPAFAPSATGAPPSFMLEQAGPSNQYSELPPALVAFDGSTFYAITGTDGIPYIAASSSLTEGSFTFEQAESSARTNLPPAVAVFQGLLYYGVIGTNAIPYLASSPDGSGGSFPFNPVAGTGDGVESEAGPALAAFNGKLYYALANSASGNNLWLGTSADGSSFTFENVGGSNYTPLRPALTVFAGKLVYAFTGGNGLPYLGSSATAEAGSFDFAQVSGDSNLTSRTGPALAAFNGKLYYALLATDGTIQLGVSSDGETFTFTALEGSGSFGVALATNEPVNFYRDVYPILKLVTDYAWTNQLAFNGHAPGSNGNFLREPYLGLLADPLGTAGKGPVTAQAAREFVFNFIRPPAEETPSVPPPPAAAPPDVSTTEPQRGDLMPKLFGNGGSPAENDTNGTTFPNQWLSLTNHQLTKFQRWVNGDFVTGTPGEERWSDLPPDQALDFAALQPTIGGGFHPGIELTYMMGDGAWFAAAFRFTRSIPLPGGGSAPLVPGGVAAYMSVPWQGDFWSCNTSWWPPQRPDVVVEVGTQEPPKLTAIPWFRGSTIPPYSDGISNYDDGYETMADEWPRFGLVTPIPGQSIFGEQVFAETERDPTLDNPSILEVLDAADVATGNSLDVDGNVTVQPTNGSQTQQQWRLVPYSGSPDYFFVQSVSKGQVLTAASGGGAVTLAAQASPADAAQLWRYLPSGYPGAFYLASKLNSRRLTSQGPGKPAVTAVPSSTALQVWRLSESS